MRAVVILFALPLLAHAQVYKCVVNGKTQYAERPCAPDARSLNIRDDVTAERQAEAARVANREKALAAGIEAEQLYDKADRTRAEGNAKATAKRNEGRCANYQRVAHDAEHEADLYINQRFKDDAKRRQKEAEDAHFSECYGTVR